MVMLKSQKPLIVKVLVFDANLESFTSVSSERGSELKWFCSIFTVDEFGWSLYGVFEIVCGLKSNLIVYSPRIQIEILDFPTIFKSNFPTIKPLPR